MWLILKIFETRRPWASSLTRETVPSNKQDDSSTLLKKIKESLPVFWRMVFHLYTPGLCIVKLKLALKF